jgi:4-hydroxy-tetrahydrodipicolinate reductase
MPEPVRIALCGAAGRMGSAIVRLVAQQPGFIVAHALERAGHPLLGTPVAGTLLAEDLTAALRDCDVLVDFTLASETAAHARAAAAAGVPLVCGVTGLDEAAQAALHLAAERIAVVHAPNMSAGVAVLGHLLSETQRRLPGGYDVEIVELHHRRKFDAPSGTALHLAEILAQGQPGSRIVCGRCGPRGAGDAPEIVIHSLRAGEVVGEHRVLFAGPGERIELTHRAESRDAFASGALAAARFVRGRPRGLYGMNDVLGIA